MDFHTFYRIKFRVSPTAYYFAEPYNGQDLLQLLARMFSSGGFEDATIQTPYVANKPEGFVVYEVSVLHADRNKAAKLLAEFAEKRDFECSFKTPEDEGVIEAVNELPSRLWGVGNSRNVLG